MPYFYKQTEPGLFTVGAEDAAGQWHPESDHTHRVTAGDRVAYLNGGMERKWLINLAARTVAAIGFIVAAVKTDYENSGILRVASEQVEALRKIDA